MKRKAKEIDLGLDSTLLAFINGLPIGAKKYVSLQSPGSIEEAFSYAQQFEQVDRLGELSPLAEVYKQAKKTVDNATSQDVALLCAAQDRDKDLQDIKKQITNLADQFNAKKTVGNATSQDVTSAYATKDRDRDLHDIKKQITNLADQFNATKTVGNATSQDIALAYAAKDRDKDLQDIKQQIANLADQFNAFKSPSSASTSSDRNKPNDYNRFNNNDDRNVHGSQGPPASPFSARNNYDGTNNSYHNLNNSSNNNGSNSNNSYRPSDRQPRGNWFPGQNTGFRPGSFNSNNNYTGRFQRSYPNSYPRNNFDRYTYPQNRSHYTPGPRYQGNNFASTSSPNTRGGRFYTPERFSPLNSGVNAAACDSAGKMAAVETPSQQALGRSCSQDVPGTAVVSHCSPNLSPSLASRDAKKNNVAIINPTSSLSAEMMLVGTLGSCPCLFLLDSGAEISIVSQAFYHVMSPQPELKSSRYKQVVGVSGAESKIIGQIEVEVCLGGFHRSLVFQVLPGVRYQAIIGKDVICRYVAFIDIQHRVVQFHHPSQSVQIAFVPNGVLRQHWHMSAHGKLLSDILVPAGKKVAVKVVPDNDIFAEFLQLSTLPVSPSLFVVETQTVDGSLDVFCCFLTNTSGGDLTLLKGLKVVQMEVVHNAELMDVIIGVVDVPTVVDPPFLPQQDDVPVFEPEASSIVDRICEKSSNDQFEFCSAVSTDFRPKPPISHDLSKTNITSHQRQEVVQFLDLYRDVFAVSVTEIGCTNVISHVIDVGNSAPIKSRVYSASNEAQRKIKTHIEELLDTGIIVPSFSNFASPIMLVPKKDGTTRLVIDFRKINKVTTPDVYPLARINEILQQLGGAKYFTSLDLLSGYHQVAMDPASEHLTAFVCRQGLFHFKRMPFGLINAGATFSRLMDIVLKDLVWSICLVFLDDILVFSSTFADHLLRLGQVFSRLREAHLTLKPTKCYFFQESISFLGHVVSSKGIEPDKKKVTAVENFPIPTTRKSLKAFLGLSSYYRKYVAGYAKIASPLHKLLMKDVKFEWSTECEAAFTVLKARLTTAPILAHPNMADSFILFVDASAFAVGVVLAQIQEGCEKVIAYAGRALNKHERNYSVYEKEALAVVYSVKYFNDYLDGKHFKIFTDCNSVAWLFSHSQPSGRIARWVYTLQKYNYEISYRSGVSNANADAISRITNFPGRPSDDEEVNIASYTAISIEKTSIQSFQQSDKRLGPIIRVLKNFGTSLGVPVTKLNTAIMASYKLDDALLLWRKVVGCKPYDEEYKLVIPDSQKERILKECHDNVLGGHFAFLKTLKRVQINYWWLNMSSEIYNWCTTCKICALRKRNYHPIIAPLQPLVVQRPWEVIAMDCVGPFIESNRLNKHVVVFTDLFSKWAMARPLKSIGSKEIADVLFEAVVCFGGTPAKILTDLGTNFVSKLMMEIYRVLGITKLNTSPYRPSTNGGCEVTNREIVRLLSTYTASDQKNWDDMLPAVLLAYNTSYHTTMKETPFCILFGRQCSLPLDVELLPASRLSVEQSADAKDIVSRIKLVQQVANEARGAQKLTMKKSYDLKVKGPVLKLGDLVMIKVGYRKKGRSPKLDPKFYGPFKLLTKIGQVNFRVDDGKRHGKGSIVHVNRMKLYVSDSTRIIKSPDVSTPPQDGIVPVPDEGALGDSLRPQSADAQGPVPPAALDVPTQPAPNSQSNVKGVSSTPLSPSDVSVVPQGGPLEVPPGLDNMDFPCQEMEIIDHRRRHQCLELLVKKVEDPPAMAIWKAKRDVKNAKLLHDYFTTALRRSSRVKATVVVCPRGVPRGSTCCPRQGRSLVHCVLLMCLYFLFSIDVIMSTPNILGNVYDCSRTKYEGIFTYPDISDCKDTFSSNKVTRYKASVREYKPKIDTVNLYHCKKISITLDCDENFIGVKAYKMKRKYLLVTKAECFRALKYKRVPQGSLVRTSDVLWSTVGHHAYKCRWERDTKIIFVKFELHKYLGYVKGEDVIIHQDLTVTDCYYPTGSCIPKESPLTLIQWIPSRHDRSMFVNLGIMDVHQTGDYVVIPGLGIGGAVIKQTRVKVLLDIGYVLVKVRRNGTIARRNDKNFAKFAKNYARKTKFSVQRELDQGHVGSILFKDDLLLQMLSKSNCALQRQMHKLQSFLLQAYPTLAHNLLTDDRSIQFESVGDAWLRFSCVVIDVYTVFWSRKLNGSCFHLFPLTSPLFEGIKYLELTTRRVLTQSHTIACSAREKLAYVKKHDNTFVAIDLAGRESVLTPQVLRERYPHVVLTKLAGFNERLFHVRGVSPHPSTLFNLLTSQRQNLGQLSEYAKDGDGSIAQGLANVFSTVFQAIGNTGSTLIHSLADGFAVGTKAVTNSTVSLITAGAGGISSILEGLGGISNFILFLLVGLIVFYLFLMRFQGEKLPFLFPPPRTVPRPDVAGLVDTPLPALSPPLPPKRLRTHNSAS